MFQLKPELFKEVCELSHTLIENATDDMQQPVSIEIAIDPAIDNSEVLAYRVLKVV